ncbi:Pyridine nucleotide-disulfide oxidoreductase [Rasamsonia emersonii CBS 393.64]|uniref:Pyridine nucleotide-disulfide oxidoreductase n=1 Tax=Rasamsonia emersonii (strain ATCC 16479 / CBS 393.64 / IMI 116815) TaxID=1408163 RepID=A0A0F4YYB0_RASE3|nr:Pyridine nucleotide-disulfide oxidoreductase [Rasamsonia emersonii CBS 393.64]KKA23214.1 Pyridine nucleotide-disulfide oxidoreductase [Rasamsonia emersonii CBS 393.64]
MVRPKKVAIVGPSGLVTAKTLLHNIPNKGMFEPVVFDQKRAVGGLWCVHHPGQRKSFDGSSASAFISPSMRTNLSRFSVCFSDFSWEELLSSSSSSSSSSVLGHGDSDGPPMFPQAWQVGRYLDRYAERYIPREILRLGCRVVRTEWRKKTLVNDVDDDDGHGHGHGNWMVEWVEEGKTGQTAKKTHAERFDYLVVASGYFSCPYIPDIPGLEQFNDRVIHSSSLRDVEELMQKLQLQPSGSKLVVVGGSLSGAEAASSLALHLSSSVHAPATSSGSSSRRWQGYSVHHISTRPFWAVPTCLPSSTPGETCGSFLPLDLVMYDLSRRPPGEVEYWFGPVPPQRSVSVNEYFKSLLGTDQSDIGDGSLAQNSAAAKERPPWVAVTDSYAEFVRSGDVRVTIGRVCAVHRSSRGPGTLQVQLSNGETTTLEDVAAIVFATGFTPFDSLSFLPEDVLSQLEYSAEDPFLPLVLDGKGSSRAEVPDLGFVGMYRGPYWGVMEMQARRLARQWSPSPAEDPGRTAERQQLRTLRNADPRLARAQFPMGDYVGLMESFARELGIARYELPGQDRRSGPVVPARYAAPTYDPSLQSEREVTTTLNSLQAVMSGTDSSIHQQSTAKAIFRALQGKWKYSRTVQATQADPSPSSSSGIAVFHPRYPSDAGYEGEYLYEETNTDRSDNSVRTVYRFRAYASTQNKKEKEPVHTHIAVWTADNLKTASRYSHGLYFDQQRRQRQQRNSGNIYKDKASDSNESLTDRVQYHYARGTGAGSGSASTLQSEHEHKHEHEYEHEYEYAYTFRTKGVAITSWEVVVISSRSACGHRCRTVYERDVR